jgi:hypothetical protein
LANAAAYGTQPVVAAGAAELMVDQSTGIDNYSAEAVKPYVSTVERNHVFMAIGAGETFAAIRGLVKSVAIKRIPLPSDLVQLCTTWLHAYVGHNDERYLHRLIDDYLVPYSVSVPATARVNRLPTAPKPGQLVALTAQRHRFGCATDAGIGIRRGTG